MTHDNLRNELLTLPNQLTLLRILSVPAVVVLMLEKSPNYDIAAAIVFTFASLTDFFDGLIAKRFGMESKIGILLDPLADKLLVTSVLIVLVHQGKIDMVIPVILIWREFVIMSLRSMATTHGVVISASSLAKSKTSLQVVGLIGIIVGRDNALFDIDWFIIGYTLILCSLFVSIISGYQYLRKFFIKTYNIGN